MTLLTPYYNKNSVTVVYATDENYAQALTVAIASLVENASANFNYEIYILSDNLCFEYLSELEKIAGNQENIYIKVLNIAPLLKKIGREILFESRQIKMSAYYRLFIPEIFQNFPKALYLDVDTIILEDITELFNINLGDYKIAAVPDAALIHASVNNIDMYKYYSTSYYNNFALEMDSNYFNSGVILYNIPKIDSSFIELGINKLASGVKPELHDQDILNYIGKGSVKLLDKKWNSQILNFLEAAEGPFNPKALLLKNQDKYITGAKIIHFISHLKPWTYPEVEGGKIFWHYARKSSYYEVMLFENLLKRSLLNVKYTRFNLIAAKLKYFKYKLLAYVLNGEKQEKYKNKQKTFKEYIIHIKKNM